MMLQPTPNTWRQSREQTIAKNEDLEALSWCNSLCIIGIAEYTNSGHPDVFVERLLTELFTRQDFSDTLIVEGAPSPLGP